MRMPFSNPSRTVPLLIGVLLVISGAAVVIFAAPQSYLRPAPTSMAAPSPATDPTPTAASDTTNQQTIEQTSQQPISFDNASGSSTASASARGTIELTVSDATPTTTALDVLKASGATVEVKSYGSAGSFIVSIDDLAGSAANYWAFYVNGEYAQAAADKTMVKTGDTLTFAYEKITNQ